MAARALKAKAVGPNAGKDGFLASDKSVRIARGERGNGGKALGHDAALFASERRDEREIVRRRELLRWGLSARSRAVYDDAAASAELLLKR